MNAVLTVAEIVAPVMILAGIGFAWVRLGHEYRIRFVTQLATTLAVPCLIFVALMQSEIEPSALASITLAAVVSYAAIILAMTAITVGLGLETRTFLAPLVFGNTGNLGLPLALFAFGQDGLAFAVVIFAVMAVLSFTIGLWMVSGDSSIRAIAREPLVGATFLGAIFLWQGWETPRFLTSALELVAQLAIPLMLITLGVALARLTPTRLVRTMGLALMKSIVCITVAWLVGRAFALEGIPFAVLVVQVATPVAVTSYLLAEKYEADADAVAGLVVVSTLLSIAVLPLLLALLI